MKKLFIGKLSFSTTEDSLRKCFAEFEPISTVKIITDRETGRSRGFGFIEIESAGVASEAIAKLDGVTLDGAIISVNEARPQELGARGGSGRGGNFGRSTDRPRRPM